MNSMKRIRITPFLIAMPVAIVWSVFLLIKMINRDGMAVLMSGFVSVVILISVVFLVIDRDSFDENQFVVVGFD